MVDPRKSRTSSWSDQRVLLVEDDAIVALNLERILLTAKCSIIGPVTSTIAALTSIAIDEPDVALVDINFDKGIVLNIATALEMAQIPFALISGDTVDILANGHAIDMLPARLRSRPLLIQPFNLSDILWVLSHMIFSKEDHAPKQV